LQNGTGQPAMLVASVRAGGGAARSRPTKFVALPEL
jgi:hypothetical protein